MEPVLTDGTADRAGEDARLQRRHADLAVELRAPRLLVSLDQQAYATPVDGIPGP
jgi:hypothetical protein